MAVTRQDVADRAGVSVSAVSRTMNKSGYVAKEKQEAILKAVQELGYRPNPLVSSLKQKKTNQLCFFGKDLTNPFNVEIYQGMAYYAKEKGYIVFLNATLDPDEIRNMMVDGIILPNESIALEVQRRIGERFVIPMVCASYGIPMIYTKNIPYIDVDVYDGVCELIEYLRVRGHKKIALSTPYDDRSAIIRQPRNIAYFNCMKPVLQENIYNYIYVTRKTGKDEDMFAPEDYFTEGAKGARDFLERNEDATAVVCFNDEYAIGMLREFDKLGVRVPDDISMVSVDGIFTRKYVTPLLTTIDLHMKEQGMLCVQTLIDKINDKKVKAVTSIPYTLLEGESVKSI